VRIFGQPVITPGMGRKYPQGLEMANNHPVYTSRGVGVLGIPVRIACRPEVTVLTLTGMTQA
jgi:predicted MPP superfamily phosphohydrolase